MLGNLEPTFVTKGSTKHNSGRNSAATTAEGFFFFLHTKDTDTSIPRRYSRSWPRAAPSLSALLEAAHWTKHGTGQSILRAQPRLVPFFSPYSLLRRTRLIFIWQPLHKQTSSFKGRRLTHLSHLKNVKGFRSCPASPRRGDRPIPFYLPWRQLSPLYTTAFNARFSYRTFKDTTKWVSQDDGPY